MESIDILKITAAVLALAVAIIGHEIMHGWVAYMYGDTTAKNAGRLSINPLVHVDLIGTILVPASMYFIPMLMGQESGFLFGWAKPVPINMGTVIKKGGYKAAMQVDLAGIAYNLFLAILFSILFTYMLPNNLIASILEQNPNASMFGIVYYIMDKLSSENMFIYFVGFSMILNIMLAIFNLLPIPQFDGAHFLMHLALKFKMNIIAEVLYKGERFGIIIVVIVLMSPLKDILLFTPINTILNLLLNT